MYRHWPITNFFWFGISGSAFPFKKFVRLCLSRFVMRTLPHKHRVCECFSLGLPFLKRLYFEYFESQRGSKFCDVISVQRYLKFHTGLPAKASKPLLFPDSLAS